MAPKSVALSVGFPVFSTAFLDDRTIVLGGGGGASKTGVRNRLTLYKIDLPGRAFAKLDEYELPKDEDAPMSMAVHRESKQLVCGINADEAKTRRGENLNLRVFTFTEESLNFEKAHPAIDSRKPDDYQKCVAFSKDGKLLAIGNTSGQFSLLRYPELTKVWPCVHYGDDEEIYDVDFNETGDLVMGTSAKKLHVFSTKPADESPAPSQTIERPSMKKGLQCTFRAAKFGKGQTAGSFFTVVNAAPAPGTKRPSPSDRKSFVSQWDAKTWKLVKTRAISQRPLTAFEISANGEMLAYGSSDLSVGVVNAKTLQPVLAILRAHDFPATALRWSPSGDLVLSASADNTVRCISTSGPLPSSSRSTAWLIIYTLLALLLAILVQLFAGEQLRTLAREHLHL